METKLNPAVVASYVVSEIMRLGLEKHEPDSWKWEDEDFHINKGIRHALTYQLIRDGHAKPDGENHLKLAITRLAFAITNNLIPSEELE